MVYMLCKLQCLCWHFHVVFGFYICVAWHRVFSVNVLKAKSFIWSLFYCNLCSITLWVWTLFLQLCNVFGIDSIFLFLVVRLYRVMLHICGTAYFCKWWPSYVIMYSWGNKLQKYKKYTIVAFFMHIHNVTPV
jgi:hypothetical protein